MNKPNYFAVIPANVRYDKEIPDKSKLLYGEITCLCNEKGYCWASNSYFAKLYGVKKETISRLVSELEKRGYIKTVIIYKPNSKEIQERRIYIKISIPITENVNTPIEENINTPIDINVIDNNTSINNTSINNIYSQNEENSDSKLKSNKENDYLEIFNYYVSKRIIQHRKLNQKMKSKIKTTLKDYTVEELKKIIDNYSEIVLDDRYYFEYKWTLTDFLSRGLEKFEDLEVAKKNYLKDQYKGGNRNGSNGSYNGKVQEESSGPSEEMLQYAKLADEISEGKEIEDTEYDF